MIAPLFENENLGSAFAMRVALWTEETHIPSGPTCVQSIQLFHVSLEHWITLPEPTVEDLATASFAPRDAVGALGL